MPTAKRKTAVKGRSAAAKRKSAVKSPPAPRTRKPRRSDLLVIECDSQNLAIDGMHLGTLFDQFARNLFPDKSIALIRTSREDKLRDDLARVFAEHGRFRVRERTVLKYYARTIEHLLATPGRTH